jgi:annexin A7/11
MTFFDGQTVESIENKPLYFAQRLEESMHGMGTNEDMLNRLVLRVRRDPALLNAVKGAYMQKYGKSLSHRINGETSGDYRKLLMAIVGN